MAVMFHKIMHQAERSTRLALGYFILAAWPATTLAQTVEAQTVQTQSVIESAPLAVADAYDAGILDTASGGLDAALWQGTTARRAIALLEDVPMATSSAVTRDLIRAAILSGGVPPRLAPSASGTTDMTAQDFATARLRAVIRLDDPDTLKALIDRVPSLVSTPQLRAEIALLQGDTDAACFTTDTVQEGRSEPVWMRLRAYCHVLRGEIAAAELTADLLKNTGYEDADYFVAMDVLLGIKDAEDTSVTQSDPLVASMAQTANLKAPDTRSPRQAALLAQDENAEPEVRLEAMYMAGFALSNADMTRVLSHLAIERDIERDVEPDAAEGSIGFDIDGAVNAPPAMAMGQLYGLATSTTDVAQSAKAIDAMLTRALAAGSFDRFAHLLDAEITRIPSSVQAQFDVMNFLRVAVNRGDIATLQGLYLATDDLYAYRPRMALIADAMGNGFVLGDLGQDIDTRLQETGAAQQRAIRDSYIALALGARLSDDAADVLARIDIDTSDQRVSDPQALIALEIAARASSRAETALRAASLLGESGPTSLDNISLYRVINALSTAGLTTFAGRVAAEDLLSAVE